MTTEFIAPTSKDHWLALRGLDITSTESPALFGLSPYETPFELWHRKKSGDLTSLNDNERMQAGRHIEPAIAAIVAERFGVFVEPLKTYARDTESRMGSSFDFRITFDGDEENEVTRMFRKHGPGILECKNVDFLVHRDKWTADECPDHIEIQLQHQLELTGMEWGIIAALVGGNKIWLYIRARDAAVGHAIRQRIAAFWISIANNSPPPPVYPDDAEAVIALHQFASPGSVLDARADQSFAELAAEYRRLGKEIEAMEEARSVLKADIFTRAGEVSKVFLQGFTLSTGVVADSDGKLVTQDMVGQRIGGRHGYRMLRVTEAKQKQMEQA